MKVYVITGNNYDDYTVYGVFSSKEKAETFMRGRTYWGYEELELNKWLDS